MNNSIEVSVEFYFKGIRYAPTTTIDLDELMERYHALPDIYALLAKLNDISIDSYEYDVMLSEPLCIDKAIGAAADFVDEDGFDSEGFEQHWHAQKALQTLQAIAKRHMDIDDLEQEPSLKQALLEAYRLGKDEPKS